MLNYVLPTSAPFREIAIAIHLFPMGFFLSLLAVITAGVAFKGGNEIEWDIVVGLIFVGGMCSSEVARLLWNRRARICEHGMVWGRRFLPWTDIDLCNWNKSHGDRLVVELGQRTRVTMVVTPEQRAAVDAIVREKLNSSDAKL